MDQVEQSIVVSFSTSQVFVLTWAAYLCNERHAAVVSDPKFVCTLARYFGTSDQPETILYALRNEYTNDELNPLISASLISLASPNVLVDNMRLAGSYIEASPKPENGNVYVAKNSLVGRFFADSSKIVEALEINEVRSIWLNAKADLDQFLKANPTFRSIQAAEMQDTSMLKMLRKALPKSSSLYAKYDSKDNSNSNNADHFDESNLYQDLILSETKIHELCDKTHEKQPVYSTLDAESDLAKELRALELMEERLGYRMYKYQYLSMLARLYTVQNHIPRAFEALFESFIGARRCVVNEQPNTDDSGFDKDFIWLPNDRGVSIAKLVFLLLGLRISFKSSTTLKIPEPLNVPIERLLQFVNTSTSNSVYIPHKIEAGLLTLFYKLPSATVPELHYEWSLLLQLYEHITLSPSNNAIFHFLSAYVAIEACSYDSACMHLNLCSAQAEKLTVYPVYMTSRPDPNPSLSFPDLDLKWQIILFKYFQLNKCFEALLDLLNAAQTKCWTDTMQQTQTLILCDTFIQLQDVHTAEQILEQLSPDVEYHEFIKQQLNALKVKLLMAKKQYTAAVDLAEQRAAESRDRGEFNLELKFCVLAVKSLILQNKAYAHEACDWIKDLEEVCTDRCRPAELVEILLLKTRLCTKLNNLKKPVLLNEINRSVRFARLRVQCEFYDQSQTNMETNTKTMDMDEAMLQALYFNNEAHEPTSTIVEMQELVKKRFPGGCQGLKINAQHFAAEFKHLYKQHLLSKPSESVQPFLQPSKPDRFESMNTLKYKRMRPSTGSPRRTHPKKRILQ